MLEQMQNYLPRKHQTLNIFSCYPHAGMGWALYTKSHVLKSNFLFRYQLSFVDYRGHGPVFDQQNDYWVSRFPEIIISYSLFFNIKKNKTEPKTCLLLMGLLLEHVLNHVPSFPARQSLCGLHLDLNASKSFFFCFVFVFVFVFWLHHAAA